MLVGVLVIGAGAGEYPLFGRPGLRYLLLEALPPLAAGALLLAIWVLPRGVGGAARAVAAAAIGLLLARAAGRFAGGAPPAAFLEFAFLVMAALGIGLVELVRRLPTPGD